MRLFTILLFLTLDLCHASLVEPECVDGKWVHQTPDQLPHIDCARSPPAVRWSALTPERCRAWREDSDWPTQDLTITRRASWRSARALVMTKLRNKRLWIVGDSISSLFVHGITCEMSRYGLDSVFDADLQREIDDVDPDAWVSGPPFKVAKVTLANTTVVGKGWARIVKSEFEAMFPLGDIFVFAFGLHYGEADKDTFVADYKWLLNECQLRQKTCVFREISAQLFANGAYDREHPENNGHACTYNPDVLWNDDNWVWQQNVIVRQLIETKYTSVRILPFYNISAVRGGQTEGHFCGREAERTNPAKKSDCFDCSHFTMTPVLWAKVVDEMYKVL